MTDDVRTSTCVTAMSLTRCFDPSHKICVLAGFKRKRLALSHALTSLLSASRHQSLWLTQRVTLVWSSTAVSQWRIMFRPSVGLATFNCASCVLSPDLSQPTQQRRLCMLSLQVDSTTATPCCTVLPTHYSGGCSPYRTLLLPARLRVHGDGITSLQF